MNKPFRKGDILFERGTSFVSRLIEYYDHGQFSHCAIAISPSQILEAEWNVKVRVCDNYLSNYEVVDLGLTDQQRDLVITNGMKLLGSYYDYRKIISYFINRVVGLNIALWDDTNAYICSELIEVALAMSGIIPSSEIDKRSPNELYNYLLTLKN